MRALKITALILLVVIGMLIVVMPTYAEHAPAWWNASVKVTTTAELEPYRDSYWASILRPSFLKCESASLTIGNDVYIGSIYTYWWWFRKCGLSFEDVPANQTGTLTLYYIANGSRSYQKSIFIGKTWMSTWRLPKVVLPWSPLD